MRSQAKLVEQQCALAPGAVDAKNSTGECTRGPLDHRDADMLLEQGLRSARTTITLTIPTHHLPSSTEDTELSVADPETGGWTDYVVRWRRPVEDGLLNELFLVPA